MDGHIDFRKSWDKEATELGTEHATDRVTVTLIVVVLGVDVGRIEVQVVRVVIIVGSRRPKVAVATDIVDTLAVRVARKREGRVRFRPNFKRFTTPWRSSRAKTELVSLLSLRITYESWPRLPMRLDASEQLN